MKRILLFVGVLLVSVLSKATTYDYYVAELNGTVLTFKGTNTPPDASGSIKTWNTANTGTSYPGWYSYASTVTDVVFEESFAEARPKYCCRWFNEFNNQNFTSITNLQYLNTSEVVNMFDMFSYCRYITSLDLSGFDTRKVTNMTRMFKQCPNLRSITFGANFDTSIVTSMEEMFCACGMTTIDVSGFNTSKVTTMEEMFSYCPNLTSLDLRNFNTGKVQNFSHMFSFSPKLTSINIGNFTTNQAQDVSYMFSDCSNLRYIDLTAMTSVHWHFTSSEYVFNSVPSSCLIYMPKNQTRTGTNFVNTTDGTTFTCDTYAMTDKADIEIPHAFTATNITYNRSFTADQKQTVYLPFAISTTGKGTFYEYDNYNSSTGKVQFTEVSGTTTTPNTPYLFVPSSTGTLTLGGGEVSATTATEDPASATEGFHGVTTKVTFAANQSDIYGWASNAFKKAGNGSSFSAGRAYLKLSTASAPEMLDVDFGDGNVTGIDNIELINSKGNAPAYNLNGQRVSNTYQGVVIKNGKKQLVK